jgi:hypothetical protein
VANLEFVHFKVTDNRFAFKSNESDQCIAKEWVVADPNKKKINESRAGAC